MRNGQQQYQFAGGPPRVSLDGVPPDVWKNYNAGLVDILGVRLYDSAVIAPNITGVPTTRQRLFSVPVGGQLSILGTTTQVAKTTAHTNMEQGGALPRGQSFLWQSLQVYCSFTDTILPEATSGSAIGYPTIVGGTGTVASSSSDKTLSANLVKNVLEQTNFAVQIGEKEYEEGLGFMFPSKYGFSGHAAIATTAAATTLMNGITNNGFGREYQFLVPHWVEALRNFGVNMQFINSFNTFNNGDYIHIKVFLEGVLFRSVQ